MPEPLEPLLMPEPELPDDMPDDMPEPDEPDDMPGEVPVALLELPWDCEPIAPGAGVAPFMPLGALILPELVPGVWPVTPV